ncbi:MAG: hypothetical protein WC473_02665 [Patescibacteria group bacterium]|jgi:hypothetical protein
MMSRTLIYRQLAKTKTAPRGKKGKTMTIKDLKNKALLQELLNNPELLDNLITDLSRLIRREILNLTPIMEKVGSLVGEASDDIVPPITDILNELLPAICGIGGTAIVKMNPSIIALIEFFLNEMVDVSEGIEEAQGRLFNARARLRKAQLYAYLHTGDFNRSEAMALVLADMGSGSIMPSANEFMQGAKQGAEAIKGIGGKVRAAHRGLSQKE